MSRNSILRLSHKAMNRPFVLTLRCLFSQSDEQSPQVEPANRRAAQDRHEWLPAVQRFPQWIDTCLTRTRTAESCAEWSIAENERRELEYPSIRHATFERTHTQPLQQLNPIARF